MKDERYIPKAGDWFEALGDYMRIPPSQCVNIVPNLLVNYLTQENRQCGTVGVDGLYFKKLPDLEFIDWNKIY